MDKNRIIEDYLQGKHPIEQESWELPSAQELDNAEAEFDQLMEARKKPRRRLRLWPLAAAACVAGIIAILLAPPKPTEEQLPLALEEPMINEQQPVVKDEPVKVKVQTQTNTPSEKSKKAPKRKRVVSQQPSKPQQPAEEAQSTPRPTGEGDGGGSALLVENQPSPSEERGERLLPPDRQALVDIFLAEEALQVVYGQQAQTEKLRAFTAGLQGKEPETSHLIISF
ncbi:MAG: hypothetical protein J6W52_10620 [Bacteroidaceae bacterium]|nr:hypothetical protein [Bacteroidaceae bacterium]